MANWQMRPSRNRSPSSRKAGIEIHLAEGKRMDNMSPSSRKAGIEIKCRKKTRCRIEVAFLTEGGD